MVQYTRILIRGETVEQTIPLKKKTNVLLLIVYPILITQLALYMMTFFDVLMTGRYDKVHLAAVSVGSSLWTPVFTGLAGILSGLTPIIANYIGAKTKEHIQPTVHQGLYLSFVLSGIIFALIYLLIPTLIEAIDLEPAVRPIAIAYLKGMSIGLFPLFAYTVFRAFFDALGATRVSMFIILLTAPINIVFNYLLIFGKLGLPEMGGAGAGYASGITYWIVCAIAFWIALRHKKFQPYQLGQQFKGIQFKKWKEILAIGVPIGIAIFVETSIFSAVTLLMSHAYSTATVSAHQIALNFTSMLYMIPLSISFGATIVVGQMAGAGRWKDAKQYSFLALSFALGFSLISIAILLSFRYQIAGLYTTDAELIALAGQFMVFSAFFQLSDAILAPMQGALRGYKDVNVTFIMAIVSFWFIGLPVGYLTATYTTLGPFGYWIGLITGLSIGAIALFVRLRMIQKRKETA